MKPTKMILKKQPVLESEVRKQVQEYLRWNGWFVYYNLQGLGCYPGLSDLVATRDGQTVHVEIKKPNGRQSEKQVEFQQAIEAAGGRYIVAKKIEDVECLSIREVGKI